MKEEKKINGILVQLLASAVAAVIGGVLLFVPQAEVKTICLAACIALIVLGLVAICKFFLSGGYKTLSDHHFSIGIMLLILGISGLLRVVELALHFEMILGIVALILGTLVLQSAVQLKVLGSKLWIPETVFAVVTLAGAFPVLAEIQPVLSMIRGYPHWVCFVAGILSLVSLLFAWIGLRGYEKRKAKQETAAEDDNFAEE